MAKYEKNRRFYWLQLKEDFFEEDAIDWLEEQPNGKEYSLFYLKLCLKSLRTNGILIRKVGQMLIPYDHNKLAELTKTNPDTVLVAMKLLTKIGLVEILENGEIYMKQVEEMIGSQSIGAFKKQQQRMAQKQRQQEHKLLGGQREDICPPDIEKDIEIEKKIDINIEQEHINHLIQFCNENGFGVENNRLKKQLLLWLDIFPFKESDKIILKALNIACERDIRKLKYVEGILRNWEKESLLTLKEIEINENKSFKSKEHEEIVADDGYNYGY
ncbi:MULTISPECIES: phage replisome organizer N-terminal domain-containing protein [Oceanobacillus]|uniref:phage replisome organizer N-terminal domain-containing protein n=1 Tax=Bacillaceae TaxID=186817 RepID=UPI001C214AFE|nr:MULTISPECIES: phage replisome organizer N-terminal domain-containing protein [Oceanobacillus]MBU8791576.1 phage replisome organizer N-terminal domain-containing protein [Oceanobacillus caeni]MCT1905465.1 phage replisome organizer N-terminal domain-containing protein [Oceanobacillus sojae]